MATKKASADKATRRKHAEEVFAALGFFVQGFERVVSSLRGHCTEMVMGFKRGISFDPAFPYAVAMTAHIKISAMIFHHDAITARPLLDLWRALIFENAKAIPNLSENGRKVSEDIVAEIAKEFLALVDARNRLLHATWRVGYWMPDPPSESGISGEIDFSRLLVEKYRISKSGFQKRDDLPRSHDELRQLGSAAQNLGTKLDRFINELQWHPDQIETVFSKVDGEWKLITPSSSLKPPRR